MTDIGLFQDLRVPVDQQMTEERAAELIRSWHAIKCEVFGEKQTPHQFMDTQIST